MPFIHDDFMLHTVTARKLYHDFAEDMPIYDFHCHLSPKEIAENRSYRTITEVWLGGDHYKWRAMRSAGVPEEYITGDAPPREKFLKWAEVIPQAIGNPLYHWTHLELSRYFGIDELLSPRTAPDIWEKCNRMLERDDFRVQSLISRANVRFVVTTDDPLDTLEYHREIADRQAAGDVPGFTTVVRPSFRPDKLIHIEQPAFLTWVQKLEELKGTPLTSLEDFFDAVRDRIDLFHEHQARSADHGMVTVEYEEGDDTRADAIYRAVRESGDASALTPQQIRLFKTRMMLFLSREYARRDWVMMMHIGTLRDNNTEMFRRLGPDTGFDTIADDTYMAALSRLLDAMNQREGLPRTILFNNNPRDNYAIATMIGCFQGGTRGKIQMGAAWWFNDQKDGMLDQMRILGNCGLLSTFTGMLTDSRSFLSYTRHEYFRRILCDLLGRWVEDGEAPSDMELLGKMVRDICYSNALNYFSS